MALLPVVLNGILHYVEYDKLVDVPVGLHVKSYFFLLYVHIYFPAVDLQLERVKNLVDEVGGRLNVLLIEDRLPLLDLHFGDLVRVVELEHL